MSKRLSLSEVGQHTSKPRDASRAAISAARGFLGSSRSALRSPNSKGRGPTVPLNRAMASWMNSKVSAPAGGVRAPTAGARLQPATSAQLAALGPRFSTDSTSKHRELRQSRATPPLMWTAGIGGNNRAAIRLSGVDATRQLGLSRTPVSTPVSLVLSRRDDNDNAIDRSKSSLAPKLQISSLLLFSVEEPAVSAIGVPWTAKQTSPSAAALHNQ